MCAPLTSWPRRAPPSRSSRNPTWHAQLPVKPAGSSPSTGATEVRWNSWLAPASISTVLSPKSWTVPDPTVTDPSPLSVSPSPKNPHPRALLPPPPPFPLGLMGRPVAQKRLGPPKRRRRCTRSSSLAR